MKNKYIMSPLAKKISEGIHLAYKKLVIEKAKENGELIFCKDGQIIRTKASDLLKDLKD